MPIVACSIETMLKEIGAAEDAFESSSTSLDSSKFFKKDEVHMVMRGQKPKKMLAQLNQTFARRFPEASPLQLFRDLTYPLKKGVGNAYKWGNKKDPDKWVTVSAIINRTGAVVSIADEGDGFDYEDVLRRYEADEVYYTHGGSGFDQFTKAQSLITYANGGRQLLICFVCQTDPGPPLTDEQVAAYGLAGDADGMRAFLAAQPFFAERTIVGCELFAPVEPKSNEEMVACVVRYREVGETKEKRVTLLGRFLPKTAVSNERTLAIQLADQRPCLPPPPLVATLPEPPLNLFAFRPQQDLRGFSKKKEDDQMRPAYELVARGLRRWHDSELVETAVATVADLLQPAVTNRDEILATLAQADALHVARAEALFEALAAESTQLQPVSVPIHGGFGWHAVLYDLKQFYVYFFENGAYNHPGFDVGGFLADLRRFYEEDVAAYEANARFFLAHYFGAAEPVWRADLPFFVAYGLLQRLDRMLKRPFDKWQPKVGDLLTQCEQALTQPL